MNGNAFAYWRTVMSTESRYYTWTSNVPCDWIIDIVCLEPSPPTSNALASFVCATQESTFNDVHGRARFPTPAGLGTLLIALVCIQPLAPSPGRMIVPPSGWEPVEVADIVNRVLRRH